LGATLAGRRISDEHKMTPDRAVEVRMLIEQERHGLVNRYRSTQSAMRGAFHAALFNQQRPNVKAADDLKKELISIYKAAIDTEKRSALAGANLVVGATGSELAPEDVSDRVSDFHALIRKQLQRDASAVTELFRKTQLRLQSNVVPAVETFSQAIRLINGEDVFVYVDALGRKYQSMYYLVTLSGQHYYDMANDISVSQILSSNKQMMVLDRPGHESDGMEFKTSEINTVKKAYLHPGSQGILVDGN